jgi:outer membrane protein TolC
MKKTVLIFVILILFSSSMLKGQKILTLKECYDMAMSANALAGEKDAYNGISKMKDENLKKGYLPSLDANASMIYNSEVVDFQKSLAAIPGLSSVMTPMPHDQYKVTLDVSQSIYDGGVIKSARELEAADLKVNTKQTEADLYKLRGQINGYYFSILLLKGQKELFLTYLEVIKKRISSMQSGISNGIILKSDLDVLTSEKIKLEQQLTENEIKRNALLKILSDITGTEIDPATELILPVQESDLPEELSRPELQLYDLRKEQLAASLKIIDSKRMPKAFGFATLGYGNPPGSNFFKDEFAPYYIIGASVKWNIFDWNKSKNERQIVTMQQSIIENRKSDLTDILKRQLESKNAEIQSLSALLKSDTELIALRKRITAAASSQYDNGAITATEYMNEMNTERQAIINYEIHKISLSLAKTEFLNISGNEIE